MANNVNNLEGNPIYDPQTDLERVTPKEKPLEQPQPFKKENDLEAGNPSGKPLHS